MSNTAKASIGMTPAFPVPHDSAWCAGQTYRQWLIGQIACGAAASGRYVDKRAFATIVIEQADELIARLDREGNFIK